MNEELSDLIKRTYELIHIIENSDPTKPSLSNCPSCGSSAVSLVNVCSSSDPNSLFAHMGYCYTCGRSGPATPVLSHKEIVLDPIEVWNDYCRHYPRQDQQAFSPSKR